MKIRLIAILTGSILAVPAFGSPDGFSIGLNFGADEPNGAGTGALSANEAAGVPAVKQANWNNISGAEGTASNMVADNKGVSASTGVSVEWTSQNTWSSTGRGEENNGFTGTDRDLMTGYLDTGNATTTAVTIRGLPTELTSGGYNVYVYALGGVGSKGGGYRVLDASGTELRPYQQGTAPINPSAYIRDLGKSHTDSGSYLLFKGLTAASITIEATTETLAFGGGSPRAPINAIQIAQAPDILVIGSPVGTPQGFTVTVEDSGNAVADTSGITLSFDGSPVSATSATKNADGVTTITYNVANAPLESGSSHQVAISVKDTQGRTFSSEANVTVPAYGMLPASAALPAGKIDTSKRGFIWRVHQVETADGGTLANSLARAEEQLSGLLGDNVADPGGVGGADDPASAPSPATAPISFTVSGVINFSQQEGEENGNFTPDLQMPGIPGTPGTDNIAAEVLTALEFPAAGLYTMIVNSDDGFRTSAGRHPRDVGGTLGAFDGGRGASDTSFLIFVEAPGIYPFRTIWQEGGGGANIEWLTVLADGTRVLVNDTASNAQAIKAYQLPMSVLNTLPAYAKSVSPASGVSMIGRPKTVEAVLVDAGTQVDTATVSLKLNGEAAAVTANKAGGETKVVHSVVGDLFPNTDYTAELSYSDNGGPQVVSWKFRTGPLSSTIFVVEAEDFDYDGGQSNPMKGTTGQDVNVMPYLGGAYADLGAIEGIDFRNGDGFDSDMYRQETGDDGDHEVNIAARNNIAAGNGAGETIPINSSDRGAWTMTSNYGIGWVGSGEWQNYTRVFPDNGMGGWWKVWAGLSYGGTGDGQLSGSLAKVTAGVGTEDQTTEALGQFGAPGSGGWGNNNLVPMKTPTGADAVVKLQGTNTVRFNLSSGDFDFLIFSAAPPPPPSIETAPADSTKRNEVVLDWVLRDADSKVNASTIKVFVDGQDVTAKSTSEKTATGATIHADLSGTMFSSGERPWRLTFSDNSTPPQSVTIDGKFVVNPYPTEGVFVIEAEDFNYSEDDVTGGKTNPQKGVEGMDVDVMPYLGGAYDGLSAVKGVDYNNNDADDGSIYRTEPELDDADSNEISFSSDTGSRYAADRGTFQVTQNYRIGWVSGGDWQNYTRTFPTGDFNVWAALSYDGRAPGQLNASLDLVTSNPAQPNQLTERLGTFTAPGSGGWGRNELVPMKDSNGDVAVVQMGGVQTVRFNLGSGDFDYLLFVPAEITGGDVTLTASRSGNSVVIAWDGNGTLEQADSVTGPWTAVPNVTGSSYTAAVSGTQKFFRLRQ